MEEGIGEVRKRKEGRTTVFTPQLAQEMNIFGSLLSDDSLLIQVSQDVKNGGSDNDAVDTFINALHRYNVSPQERGLLAVKLQAIVQKRPLNVHTIGDLRERSVTELTKAQGIGADMAQFIHTAFEIQNSDDV